MRLYTSSRFHNSIRVWPLNVLICLVFETYKYRGQYAQYGIPRINYTVVLYCTVYINIILCISEGFSVIIHFPASHHSKIFPVYSQKMFQRIILIQYTVQYSSMGSWRWGDSLYWFVASYTESVTQRMTPELRQSSLCNTVQVNEYMSG